MKLQRVALLDTTARRALGGLLAFAGIQEHESLDGADAAVICDGNRDLVRDTLNSGIPMLVGADAIRAGVDDLEGATRWLPMLPLRLAADVEAAQREVGDGVLGRIHDLIVTAYHGHPGFVGREDDEVRPATWFESAVWALDLVEHVVGAAVRQTTWLRPPGSRAPSLGVHQLDGGPLVTVRHLPCALGPGPAYSATIVSERGQLMLRQPFAPGGLAIWRADTREVLVPALPKPNRAGGTVGGPGGWENHGILAGLANLVAGPSFDAHEHEHALRIIHHLDRSITTDEDTNAD